MRLGDCVVCNNCGWFQSTHSVRSATTGDFYLYRIVAVSIHALRAECDTVWAPPTMGDSSFNPRTPCGVRPKLYKHQDSTNMFQSTHSVRSATMSRFMIVQLIKVSIHALRAECDLSPCLVPESWLRFNPRTPCGVRPFAFTDADRAEAFQSTHSVRSATVFPRPVLVVVAVSIHALRAECDNWIEQKRPMPNSFNPRTPCGVRPLFRWLFGLRVRFQSTHSVRSAIALNVSPRRVKDVSIHALRAECDL